jgi:Gluconate 2-dehydrogenase subunit 3
MDSQFPTRRDVLKSLTMGTVMGSVLSVIPSGAAAYAHRVIADEKVATGAYAPKFFSPTQYATLQALCDAILPADGDSGGAVEAGAPEYIDLLTSENQEYQLTFGGGMMWLDSTCLDRYGAPYMKCTASQKKEMLDLISYRKNAASDPGLSQGVEFFAFLRNLTADGFFTSAIGIKYLQYIGNTYLTEFPGCPPVPGV